MIKNNRGFAISSIIYSMLVLFLALVLLIMSNLASRKVIFDKQKNDILDKIGFNTDVSIPKDIDQEAFDLYGLTHVLKYAESGTDIFRIDANRVPEGFYNTYNDFSYYSDCSDCSDYSDPDVCTDCSFCFYNGSCSVGYEHPEFLEKYNTYLTEIAEYIFNNYNPIAWGESGFFLEGWTTGAAGSSGIRIYKDDSEIIQMEITCNC